MLSLWKILNSCLPSLNEHYDLIVNTSVLLARGLNLKPGMTVLTVFFMAVTYSM